jgi:hypothetical protein
MEQRISLITLGVADLGRARSFYESLSWEGQTVQETVFFQAGGSGSSCGPATSSRSTAALKIVNRLGSAGSRSLTTCDPQPKSTSS